MRHQNIAWVMLTVFVLASCSTSQQINSEKSIMEGIIYSIGNEPFTKLGIQTSDSTMYILKCTKELNKVLNAKQGKKVKVHYEKIEHSPEGLTIIVSKID
jgi:uncharacterized protein YcfL